MINNVGYWADWLIYPLTLLKYAMPGVILGLCDGPFIGGFFFHILTPLFTADFGT
jgi:hypothetical protein